MRYEARLIIEGQPFPRYFFKRGNAQEFRQPLVNGGLEVILEDGDWSMEEVRREREASVQ